MTGPRQRWFALVCIIPFVGCSSSTQQGPAASQTTAAKEKVDRTRCQKDGKRIVTLDVNQDQRADIWKYFERRTIANAEVDMLTCKATDLNFDTRRDVWYHYDDRGDIALEEMDLDFDGTIDMVTIRMNGKIIRQELDTNYDGTPDIWKYFEQGVLTQIHRDSNWDGNVDYWEYYEGGKLDRIGYDSTGDGQVDKWDREPLPEEGGAMASDASSAGEASSAESGGEGTPAGEEATQ